MNDIGPLTMVACLKICFDTAQLRADPQTRAPNLDGAPRRIGTFDENALEEAVRLRERYGGRVIAVLLASPDPPRELILRVLAMGADEARVIEDPTVPSADALATATILGAALKKLGEVDLVLCGEGSLDAYNRQVGPRIAEALGIASLGQVARIEERDGRLLAHRAFEDRTVVVEMPTPAVVTVGQEINEPRFPTVIQIMSASKKPTVTWRLGDLGFPEGATAAAMSGVRTLGIVAPPDSRRRISIEGEGVAGTADALARALSERGLVKVE